ncbi:hypothetical protein [Loigolactobacillus zhaoyuanensis]|uniref:DUF624 domain-containing protein n=1 Tax=Loigolactobacillus zhaoyuanensis TaxID=2486017 RepID=A0ABW8U9I1_9LACO
MLNLQTKFGKKAMQVGNWVLSLVTINFIWFLLSVPALFMLLLLHSLPLGSVYLATLLIVVVMLLLLVLPATAAVFQAAYAWARDQGSSYGRQTFAGYLVGLKNWRQNSLLAALIGVWLLAEKVVQQQVFWQTLLLVLGFFLMAAVLLVAASGISQVSGLQLALQQPFKLIAVTILTLSLFLLNTALPLLFCIVLLSMSGSAWLMIKIMKL